MDYRSVNVVDARIATLSVTVVDLAAFYGRYEAGGGKNEPTLK